jgi:hypothetical protein
VRFTNKKTQLNQLLTGSDIRSLVNLRQDLHNWRTKYIDLLFLLKCSLRENSKFLQNFILKNNTLKENYWMKFFFDICHCNSGLAFKSKNYYIFSQNCVFFIRENSQNLPRKCKWALWIRHLISYDVILKPRFTRICKKISIWTVCKFFSMRKIFL